MVVSGFGFGVIAASKRYEKSGGYQSWPLVLGEVRALQVEHDERGIAGARAARSSARSGRTTAAGPPRGTSSLFARNVTSGDDATTGRSRPRPRRARVLGHSGSSTRTLLSAARPTVSAVELPVHALDGRRPQPGDDEPLGRLGAVPGSACVSESRTAGARETNSAGAGQPRAGQKRPARPQSSGRRTCSCSGEGKGRSLRDSGAAGSRHRRFPAWDAHRY